METSPLFILGVFTLGTSVGALLVTLHRQCVVERLREEFEEQLAEAVRKKSFAGEAKASENTACTETAGLDHAVIAQAVNPGQVQLRV